MFVPAAPAPSKLRSTNQALPKGSRLNCSMLSSACSSVTDHSVTTPRGESRPIPAVSVNHLLPSEAIWIKNGDAPEGIAYSSIFPVSGARCPMACVALSVNQMPSSPALRMKGWPLLGMGNSDDVPSGCRTAIFPALVSAYHTSPLPATSTPCGELERDGVANSPIVALAVDACADMPRRVVLTIACAATYRMRFIM